MEMTSVYKVESYKSDYYKILIGVYNDFKNNAVKEYKFELEPLSFENFVKSLNEGLLHCLILFEDDIPTGFLVYTTIISEAIELNIIHCIGNKNLNQKRKLLLEKFIELNKFLMKEKIVTYPMLGNQNSFVNDIYDYGFKTVNTSVLSFSFSNAVSINKLKAMEIIELNENYSVINWNRSYIKDAQDVIHQSFKESSDALFDTRFKTLKGCADIIEKITENIYGEFLPEITKVLLYKEHPVGFCFVNLTNDKIANIPLMAILKNHRGNGFSKILLKYLITDLLNSVITESKAIRELNVSCDADNAAAVCMYKVAGFIESYSYPIAYHSGLT